MYGGLQFMLSESPRGGSHTEFQVPMLIMSDHRSGVVGKQPFDMKDLPEPNNDKTKLDQQSELCSVLNYQDYVQL
ncbi:hypothetical protein T265_01984 [Opisthorchis viverrini]|uniref:Uncharacterized protein n=1 Tax=Opisthorchis viverrini TaxID=6198 RepID=A0A075A859_OPIVI|nr:hypothetical protein T265_01984 [Opisthorchis viverrini]KER31900.1 hypothetical protein T265_01984 [Opisthorchis viverrini]